MSSVSTHSTSAAAVIARAVETVSRPKAAPADSFVMHAPLELMARAQLLPFVHPCQSDEAVARIDSLAEAYRAAGAPLDTVPSDRTVDLLQLGDALRAGDVALTDELAAAWLPRLPAAVVIGALGEAVVTSTAAAGHTPIAMALLLRDLSMPATVLSGALHTLAAQPDWQISWHREPNGKGNGNPAGLYDALRRAPRLGRPGSDFIHPLMQQAQQPGLADALLGPVLSDRYDVPAALATLTRVAAWSMLHDDRTQAPYGWTHALTMPQAVLSLAGAGVRAGTALAVGATFALGFRAAHGTVDLPDRIAPVAAEADPTQLATAASLHHDAHLVKYVLACIRAAEHDTAYAGLYFAAAASLLEWWDTAA